MRKVPDQIEADHRSSHVVIDVEGLRKRHFDSTASFELWVPSFKVNRGEFVAVVGASGCGKSTLLDMLGLISRPDSVKRFQLDVSDNRGATYHLEKPSRATTAKIRRDHIGYVLQTGGLLGFLNLKKNILLPLSMSSLPRKQALDIGVLTQQLGISGQLGKYPAKVSGGERQRAAIARAIIHRPSLILADEPTAALDPERAASLVEIFRDMATKNGGAVVMVTHNHSLVRSIADRIYSFDLKSSSRHLISTCEEISSSELKNEGGLL